MKMIKLEPRPDHAENLLKKYVKTRATVISLQATDKCSPKTSWTHSTLPFTIRERPSAGQSICLTPASASASASSRQCPPPCPRVPVVPVTFAAAPKFLGSRKCGGYLGTQDEVEISDIK